MVRLADIAEPIRTYVAELECEPSPSAPWVTGPPVTERRVAIVSTAGLQRRGDRPFDFDADDYRVIPGDIDPGDIVTSHISQSHDRTGFQQDPNVAFPLQRLQEMAADGEIGSVAAYHYSFMGATDPAAMEERTRHLAGLLKGDGVNAVLLIPV